MYSEGDLKYVVEEEAVCIVAYTGTESEVYLPSAIAGTPVSEIRQGAFAGKDFVKTIHLPDTIMVIEEGAFEEEQVILQAQRKLPGQNDFPESPEMGTDSSETAKTEEPNVAGTEIDWNEIAENPPQESTPKDSEERRTGESPAQKQDIAFLAVVLGVIGILIFVGYRKWKSRKEEK